MIFTNRTWGKVFELAIDTEAQAMGFFNNLSMMFQNQPSVAEFWNQMAADEETHVMYLNNIQESLSLEVLLAPADPQVLDKARTNRLINVEKLLHSITNLNDAYELAHELEHSEVNAVMSLLLMNFVSAEAKRNFLLVELKAHQDKLTDFTARFGDAQWRRTVVPASAPVL